MECRRCLYARAARRESAAVSESVFGRYEEAAKIHAAVARMFWSARMFDDATNSVIKASECLMKADMPEEAFDGIRSASIMMVGRSQADNALRLVGYVKVLVTRYPTSFKISAAPFESFIYKKCKDEELVG